MADTETTAYKETPSFHTVPATARVWRETIATNPTGADRVLLFKMPPKAKIADVVVSMEDLDGATPTLDYHLVLTDDTTTYNLVASSGTPSTLPQTGGVERMDSIEGHGVVTDSTLWYVALVWDTTAANFQAGDVCVSVLYTTVLDNGS